MFKDNQDRVDAYLRNEMSDEERMEFERDLDADEALREDFELTKAISKALAERQAKMEMIRRWESFARAVTEDGEEAVAAAQVAASAAPKPKPFRKWMITASAAACLMVGFFAVKSIFFTSSIQPGANYQPSFGYVASYRGNIETAPVDTLIAHGRYQEALSLTDSLSEAYTSAVDSIGAKTPLTDKDNYKILEHKHMLEFLTWRRINLLLALERDTEAFEILKSFKDVDGAYHDQANSLYMQMDAHLNK